MQSEDIEVTLEHLDAPGIQSWIGGMAAKQLKAMGTITLFIGEDNKLRVANPVHVYLGPGAVIDEEQEDRSFRWVRPIIGEAKPQFAAWKDGTLWEIEFTDDKLDS